MCCLPNVVQSVNPIVPIFLSVLMLQNTHRSPIAFLNSVLFELDKNAKYEVLGTGRRETIFKLLGEIDH